MDRLKHKVALVTGAARGLGEAIARRFHEEGATVIVNDLDLEAARRAAEPMQGHAIAADVADSDAVRRMFDEVRDYAGRLDILVNNAGISGMEGAATTAAELDARAAATASGETLHNDAIFALTDAAWDRMIAVHLRGTFLCCREGLRIMREGAGGSVINMGSIMGTLGKPGGVAYSAAKAGILGFTRALAHEMSSRRIRVNAIAPGWIETDMTAPLAPLRPWLESQIPLGHFGERDDIAWAAVYLASDEARYVTGQVLSPNGGWYMSQ